VDRRKFLAGVGVGLASTVLPARGGAVVGRQAGALPLVRAASADSLCESYLVNTKIFFANSVYGHTDAVVELLRELGVRIVRERVTTGQSNGTRNQQYAMPLLAEAGTRWHGTVATVDEWSRPDDATREVIDMLVSYYRPRVGGDLSVLMHSFGGCNEVDGPMPDGQRDPDWAPHARTMQKALWTQAKSSSATWDIPVTGPSTRTDVTAARAVELGDLSEYCDRVGNAHMYNRGTSPSRHLDDHLDILRPVFPDARRWIFTETGYNNSPQDNAGRTIPEQGAASYVVRGICDFFKRNAVYGRFELLDDPDAIDDSSQLSINRTADREAHFGLVAMTEDTVEASTPDTWRKKPEFYATKNLLGLMSDRGPRFQPGSLNLAIEGGGTDLQHLLLQKRNGKHYLLLWRDVEVCEPYPAGSRIPVAPTAVTIQLAQSRPIAVYCPRRDDRPVATYSARRSVQVSVRGDLKVLEIG